MSAAGGLVNFALSIRATSIAQSFISVNASHLCRPVYGRARLQFYERAQLWIDWAGWGTSFMRIEQILRDSVSFHGGNPALMAERITWTYADIERKSDRLAAALLREGLKSGERVALYLENSPCAVVSVFAVLKAGLVAVPLDATLEGERLHSFLAHGKIAAIVTQSRLASAAANALAAAPGARVVVLVGGDGRSAPPAGCISFEKVTTGRSSLAPPPLSDASGPAVVLGPSRVEDMDACTYSHAAIVATSQTASGKVSGAESSLSTLFGFCSIIAAVRAGSALSLQEPGQASFVVRHGQDMPELLLALAG